MLWLTLLSKLKTPAFKLLFVAAAFIGGMFTQKKLTRECATVVCPQPPPCICPKPEVQSIDFEKVKNMRGTIVLNQHYTVEMNGDSLVIKEIERVVREQLNDFKVRRCK